MSAHEMMLVSFNLIRDLEFESLELNKIYIQGAKGVYP